MIASKRRRERGFTLIEVMIVVTIIGLLLAVGLPSYQNSIQKGRRSDAISALLDVANRQEQYMLDRSTYTTDMTELGFDDAGFAVSEEGFYRVVAEACPDAGGSIVTCYLLTASPAPGSPQASDGRCATFRLDSFGRRTATGSQADECW
jgi:type IV pilus assembly protein PilE